MIEATNKTVPVPISHGRILHAEDDRVASILITWYLTEKGYRVESAPTGREALSRVLAHPGAYDLILTDQVMPELTGLEWITMLRQTGFSGKIMVLATQFSAEVEAQFQAIGVERILWKSPDLTPLHHAIEEALSPAHPAE